MSEDQNQESVEQEVQEAIAQPHEENSTEQEVTSAQESKKRNDVEYNWAEARRKMQDLERQNIEMREQLQALKKPQEPEEDELEHFSDDDILTAAQAKKLAMKLARQAAEDVVKKREAATVDERLVLKHPDFANVVTRENIETLKQMEPELAQSLVYISDPYQQGVTAYKMLKRLGIHQEDLYSKEKEKAKINSQKPVSVNAVTKSSAIGNAHLFENGLTKEDKARLWREMQECAKRA